MFPGFHLSVFIFYLLTFSFILIRMVVIFHILYVNLFFVEGPPSVEYIGQHDRGGQ